jgi:phosphoadenosine phosphosulfate reductase
MTALLLDLADPNARVTSSMDDVLPLDLAQRLAMVRSTVLGRVVFTTSFGIEDQAIAHAMFTQGLAIDVVTLDTGRLFPQTYELWAETERRYGRRIRALYPDRANIEALVARQGINGFYASVGARLACCDMRKVEPLERALAGAVAWITGVRGPVG